MKCGLLGRKLSHSYSPQIHHLLGDYSYSLFEQEPENLERFFKESNFTGINVTIPYKKAVIPYLDEISPIAQKLGAVNTIVRRNDGSLYGHNTDFFGFSTMLQQSGLCVSGKKVLVLGSGGASNTVCAVLEAQDANVVVISRNGADNYENITKHADAAVIVNATPVGMYPHTGITPVDLSLFPKLEGVLDLIYNPARTQILLDAEKRGIVAMNGLLMLVAQAKEAAELFLGYSVSDTKIQEIYKKLSIQMQNVILVGMPGCGKSTIGKLLAEKTGKAFADADVKIEELANKSIPQIFSEDGEAVFRQWETDALAELGKQSGLVIATGGGCVTQMRNYPLLHQNGIILWLKRNLENLPTDGRPLSQSGKLAEMYAIRKPLYSQFSDVIIDNDNTPDNAVEKILKYVEELQ